MLIRFLVRPKQKKLVPLKTGLRIIPKFLFFFFCFSLLIQKVLDIFTIDHQSTTTFTLFLETTSEIENRNSFSAPNGDADKLKNTHIIVKQWLN